MPENFAEAFSMFANKLDNEYTLQEVLGKFPKDKHSPPFLVSARPETFYSENNELFKKLFLEFSEKNCSNVMVDNNYIFVIDRVFVEFKKEGELKNSFVKSVYTLFTPTMGFEGFARGSGMTQWYQNQYEEQDHSSFRYIGSEVDLVQDFCLMAGEYFFPDIDINQSDHNVSQVDKEHYQSNKFKFFLDSFQPQRMGSRFAS